MANYTSRIFVEMPGLDEWIAAAHSMERLGVPTVAALEGVLAAAFAETQVRVHIDEFNPKSNHINATRLVETGRTSSDDSPRRWEGSILYGGRKGQPGYYAIYELARGMAIKPTAGTPHDWFDGLGDMFDEEFTKAIDVHFEAL